MSGPGTAVRVASRRQRADEWAVVLAAADIPHWLRQRPDGWALIVPAPDAAAALAALAAYDQENAGDGDGGVEADPGRPVTLVGILVALLLIGFFAITGPRAGRSAWFEHGSADAGRLMAGEWWRAITALTLHADAPHLAGNAVAGALLITVVVQQLGPGVGLCLLLLAGAAGNLLTAAVYGAGHVSVGASTAIFGAIGLLAVLRMLGPGAGTRRWWVVIAASLVLVTLFGAGPDADLLAHAFGLLAGGGLGLIAAPVIGRPPPAAVQWLLAAAAGAAVAGAWRAAF